MQTEITIERLGHQGDGIAPGPVFAARTLPGETVTGELDGSHLRAIRIVTPSVDRVQPPCRHYKSCGGCQLQHASEEFTARWKLEFARSALTAQGLETEFRPVLTSPPSTRRRATLAARRTKKGALAGFHGKASGTITEIPDCHLLDPALIAALPMVEALTSQFGSRKGELAVTLTVSLSGLDVSVSSGRELDGPLRMELAQFAGTSGIARLAWDHEMIAMREPPVQKFGPASVVPPPGAFLQATPEGEAALLTAVLEIVGSADKAVDLFAGCGTFALPLSKTAEVHAVEGDSEMTDALVKGWRAVGGLKKLTSEARDLFRRPLQADEFKRVDAVVIDPPRAGAEAQIRELAQSGVPVIAHVSCNPVTFARDARALVDAGYDLEWVQVVDQFRWSVHTELVGSFRLGKR
ncbi:class I SAM-dependent RNA methyltransferase [Sulfitobacter sp. BDSS02]|nr:class I SAM-dependent RNA methyltransferase [Sulfitobacter sp. BDSS02]MBR9848722.1 class I SAM-dependent RNA methyltransferase [Paracoccaceae bacterium]